MKYPGYPVVFIYLRQAVDGAFIQSLGLLRRVLDLQTRFDVLDRCCDERDCSSGHYACHCMAYRRQFVDFGVGERKILLCEGEGGGIHAVRVEEGLVKDSAVEGEGSEHDAVHKHPSYKRWGSSFIEPRDTFFSDSLQKALKGAGEAGRVRGLQTDFDCIERVADWRAC